MLKSMKTLSVMVVSGGGGGMVEEEDRGVGRDREVERKRRERRLRWCLGKVGWWWWWWWGRRGEEERVVVQPMMTTVLHAWNLDWKRGKRGSGEMERKREEEGRYYVEGFDATQSVEVGTTMVIFFG